MKNKAMILTVAALFFSGSAPAAKELVTLQRGETWSKEFAAKRDGVAFFTVRSGLWPSRAACSINPDGDDLVIESREQTQEGATCTFAIKVKKNDVIDVSLRNITSKDKGMGSFDVAYGVTSSD